MQWRLLGDRRFEIRGDWNGYLCRWKPNACFGHPFMSRGNTGYFMHNSYIFTVIPSKNIPLNWGLVGAEIGTVNQDRGAGIGGISGTSPDFVALHAFVKDKDTGVEKDLKCSDDTK